MGKINNKISIIIRTRNEERFIGHAIQSILDKIHKPEIIILDNDSNDQTLQIVRLFTQDKKLKNNTNINYTDIKVIGIKDYTPGKSLNLGVKMAKNKDVMIMSAHCELKKIDLNKHLNDLKKYICIFGNQIPSYMGKKITKRYIWQNFKEVRVENMYSKSEKRFFLHNAIAIYKKNILKKIPFNENLQGKEDRYWINEMMKNKKNKFLYDPSLEVVHHYTPNGNTWKGIG
ncbi:glycosyltransferase [Candidatus Pelagibacter sp.]|nr:glycosyltransferase [Candidatus Pelagibacter sp.]